MSDLTFFEISIYHKIALYRLRLLKHLWENQGQVIYGIPWVPDGETKVKSKRCVVLVFVNYMINKCLCSSKL